MSAIQFFCKNNGKENQIINTEATKFEASLVAQW